MEDVRPDLVEFAGPSSPVLNWPAPGEHGVISRAEDNVLQVVWERSPLVVAWPAEWIKRLDESEDDNAGGSAD